MNGGAEILFRREYKGPPSMVASESGGMVLRLTEYSQCVLAGHTF